MVEEPSVSPLRAVLLLTFSEIKWTALNISRSGIDLVRQVRNPSIQQEPHKPKPERGASFSRASTCSVFDAPLLNIKYGSGDEEIINTSLAGIGINGAALRSLYSDVGQ